jgi:hypothetical protein
MAKPKSLIIFIRNLVREEVSSAMQALLSLGGKTKRKANNGRRKRRRRRGPGRPKGSKIKAA